jgi:hypothetical protein
LAIAPQAQVDKDHFAACWLQFRNSPLPDARPVECSLKLLLFKRKDKLVWFFPIQYLKLAGNALGDVVGDIST